MVKDQRLKSEQILTLLRQIDVLTTNGKTEAMACKEVGAVEQSLKVINTVGIKEGCPALNAMDFIALTQ